MHVSCNGGSNMITREELLKKVTGKPIEATRDVFSAIKDMGFTWGATDRLVSVNADAKSHQEHCITLYGSGTGRCDKPHICYCSKISLKISAKEFLSYFKSETTLDIKEKDGDYTLQYKQRTDEPPKQITKREYLLKLVATMEDNKKEFNKTVDKQIEKLNEEMTCDGCYIQADGKYKIHEYKLEQSTAIVVSDFIKDMEKPHDI